MVVVIVVGLKMCVIPLTTQLTAEEKLKDDGGGPNLALDVVVFTCKLRIPA